MTAPKPCLPGCIKVISDHEPPKTRTDHAPGCPNASTVTAGPPVTVLDVPRESPEETLGRIIEEIAATMTPEQIAEANRKVALIMAGHRARPVGYKAAKCPVPDAPGVPGCQKSDSAEIRKMLYHAPSCPDAEPAPAPEPKQGSEVSMTQVFADSFDAVMAENAALRAELAAKERVCETRAKAMHELADDLAAARGEIAKLRADWEASNLHKNLELTAERAAREKAEAAFEGEKRERMIAERERDTAKIVADKAEARVRELEERIAQFAVPPGNASARASERYSNAREWLEREGAILAARKGGER